VSWVERRVVKVSQTVIKNTGMYIGMFADPRNSLQIGLYKLVQVKLIGSDRSCNLLQIFKNRAPLYPLPKGSGNKQPRYHTQPNLLNFDVHVTVHVHQINIKSNEINALCLPYISNPDPKQQNLLNFVVHLTVLNRHVCHIDIKSKEINDLCLPYISNPDPKQRNLLNFVVHVTVQNRHVHHIDIKSNEINAVCLPYISNPDPRIYLMLLCTWQFWTVTCII
jgi:hypothetical protein